MQFTTYISLILLKHYPTDTIRYFDSLQKARLRAEENFTNSKPLDVMFWVICSISYLKHTAFCMQTKRLGFFFHLTKASNSIFAVSCAWIVVNFKQILLWSTKVIPWIRYFYSSSGSLELIQMWYEPVRCFSYYYLHSLPFGPTFFSSVRCSEFWLSSNLKELKTSQPYL